MHTDLERCPHCGGPAERRGTTVDPSTDAPTLLFCRSTGTREDRPGDHAAVVDAREARRAEKREAVRAVRVERERRAARMARAAGSMDARALGIIR